jgi:hypothetical protein
MIYFRNVIAGGFTHMSSCGGCYDTGQQQWFVGVPGHILASGHLPFYTDLLNYPKGTNLLQSSISIVPSLLVEPITQIFGPIAAVNAEMFLCLILSALAMYFALGRWVSWLPVRIFGGALYGFSPFEIHQNIHIFLDFAIATPLFAMVLDDLLRRKKRSPLIIGLAGAGVLVLAYFTSAEMLVDLLFISVIAVLFYVVSTKGNALLPWGYTIKASLVAIGTSALLLCYPIYVQLFGYQHYVGAPQTSLAEISSDLLSPIIPTYFEWMGTAQMKYLSSTFARGIPTESSLYFGVPLVILLLFTCRRRYWWLTASLISAAILSFGPQLHVATHLIGLPMPEGILQRLPLLSALTPSRFSLFAFFFLAMQLAFWLQEIKSTSSNRNTARIVLAVTLICAAPLIPLSMAVEQQRTPALFASDYGRVIPKDSVVLAYPFPTFFHEDAEIWQATAHYSFKLPGGYVYVPDAQGHATLFTSVDTLTASTLDLIYTGGVPNLTLTEIVQIRSELRVWGVTTFLCGRTAPYSSVAVKVLSEISGSSPRYSKGIYYWHYSS